jgi:hypothetical protein
VLPVQAAAAIWEAVEANLDLAGWHHRRHSADMLKCANRMKAKELAGGIAATRPQLPRPDHT